MEKREWTLLILLTLWLVNCIGFQCKWTLNLTHWWDLLLSIWVVDVVFDLEMKEWPSEWNWEVDTVGNLFVCFCFRKKLVFIIIVQIESMKTFSDFWMSPPYIGFSDLYKIIISIVFVLISLCLLFVYNKLRERKKEREKEREREIDKILDWCWWWWANDDGDGNYDEHDDGEAYEGIKMNTGVKGDEWKKVAKMMWH